MHDGYPIMLKIRGATCIVIGGGTVAARKISTLLDASARVKVISPDVVKAIEDFEAEGKVTVERKPYEGAGDLRGGALVFAATDRDEVNASVYRDAVILGIPVNDTGKPSRSTFTLPSILRRGKLVVAVSTSGASPGLAVKLRNEMGERYGAEYERYVDFLGEIREWVLANVQDAAARAAIFQNALEFDILEVIREGQFPAYRERVMRRLGESSGERDWKRIFETEWSNGG